MKQTLCVLLLFCFFGITRLHAQNEKQTEPTSDEVLKARLHDGMRRAHQHSAPVRANNSQLLVQSKYNGREGEILDRLNVETIPANFPVYDGTATNAQYTEQMEKWYKANPTLLKKGTNTNEQK